MCVASVHTCACPLQKRGARGNERNEKVRRNIPAFTGTRTFRRGDEVGNVMGSLARSGLVFNEVSLRYSRDVITREDVTAKARRPVERERERRRGEVVMVSRCDGVVDGSEKVVVGGRRKGGTRASRGTSPFDEERVRVCRGERLGIPKFEEREREGGSTGGAGTWGGGDTGVW